MTKIYDAISPIMALIIVVILLMEILSRASLRRELEQVKADLHDMKLEAQIRPKLTKATFTVASTNLNEYAITVGFGNVEETNK